MTAESGENDRGERSREETERSKVQIVLVVRLPGNALISPPRLFRVDTRGYLLTLSPGLPTPRRRVSVALFVRDLCLRRTVTSRIGIVNARAARALSLGEGAIARSRLTFPSCNEVV